MPLFLALMFLPFFGISISFLLFFISLFALLSFLSFYLSFIVCRYSSFLSLVTPMAFYTGCCDKIYHFYPLTAFGSLWASFQYYLLACRLPSHYHCTVQAYTMPHSQTKMVFVLSLTSLNTLIQIRDKPFPYLPL